MRTCFVRFCLAFFVFGDTAVVKKLLEEKGKDRSSHKSFAFFCYEGRLQSADCFIIGNNQSETLYTSEFQEELQILF